MVLLRAYWRSCFRLSACLVLLVWYVLPANAETDVMDDANNAVKAQERGDLATALTLYTRVIDSKELDPGDNLLVYTYNNRGIIYLQRGELDKAITDFDAALQGGPDYLVYYNRGRAWSQKGDYDRAIADLNQAIELYPNFVKAYNERGLAWMNKGDAAKARADLEKAKSLHPNLKFK